MTEIEYRKLLIDSVRAGDYPEKDGLLELLNICSLRFEKTNVFTRNLWNHFQEYIHICIVPEKMIELKKHADYLKKMIYEIYPPNDDYELWGVEIKPGAMPDTEDISQEILFENIRNQIIEEIRAAKYMIWISVAWFTDPVLYQELLKKKQQGLVIEIALDDCDRNHNALGQFTRNYTQTVKRAADNKRRYAPGWVHSTCLLRGFPKGAAPHLAHDFAEQSVVCYTLCRRCPENTVAAGEGKGI